MNLIIKEVNKNIVDAFHGIGWSNWGRFLIRYTPAGVSIKQIKGIPFPKNLFAQVEAEYNIQH